MVRDAGDVAGAVAALFRGADRMGCGNDGARRDCVAVSRRLDGGRAFFDGISAGRPARDWRRPAVVCLDANELWPDVRGPAGLLAVLHADHGADEFSIVPPDEGPAAGVWGDPCAGDPRMDRGRPRADRAGRDHRGESGADSDSDSNGGHCVHHHGGLLPDAAAHSAAALGARRLRLSNIFPAEAFSLFKDRAFTIFAIASFLICIPLQFYYAFTNPFLNEVGVKNAVGKMTMGQMSELAFMVTLPWFFKRLGVKRTLILGMLAWFVRYILFGYGNSGALVWMLYVGIAMHGICYDFFFVTGQIYVDRKAPAALRAAAQGLITFITYGVGMFVGSFICGPVVDRYKRVLADGTIGHDWRSIWLVPAIGSALVLLFFLLGFREKEGTEEPAMAGEARVTAQGD